MDRLAQTAPQNRHICPKTGKPIGHPQMRGWAKWLFPIMGILSLLWFLIRVLPKPSRALYPCQHAAAPLASSFVIWLLSMGGCTLAFRNARRKLKTARFVLAGLMAVVGITAGILAVTGGPSAYAHAYNGIFPTGNTYSWVRSDPVNTPMGVAKGIHPGRVAWVQDFNSTSGDIDQSNDSIDGNNPLGYFWDENHCHQAVVNDMVSKSVRWMTGETTDAAAWDAIFRYFNRNHGKGDIGYQPGEKIAIKLNASAAFPATWPGYSSDSERWYMMTNPNDPANAAIYQLFDNESNPTPQMTIALLHQLVDVAGVAQEDIYVGDPIRFWLEPFYTRCHAAYPNVHYMDPLGQNGRERVQLTDQSVLSYSGPAAAAGVTDQMAKFIYDSDYFINLAILKRSGPIGGTLCGKNTFGVMGRTPEHLHDYIHGGGPNDWSMPSTMGSYNCIVDHMGTKQLGGKTLLYMLDGLFGGWWSNGDWSMPVKWQSMGGKWPSSVLVSQDPVAIDSVGLDLLHSETTDLAAGADNYMHEAALADNPPSGTFYDPDNTGVRLQSLGVHEHWNNDTDKQYSRNLGTGNGIELVSSEPAPSTPYLDKVNDQTFIENDPPRDIPLHVVPADAYNVTVSATSNHPEIIAPSVSGYTLTLTPAPGTYGTAVITVTAQSDAPGNPSTSVTFTASVLQSMLPPRCIDLARPIDFTQQLSYTTDSSLWTAGWGGSYYAPAPKYWSASPGECMNFDMRCWYGWGVLTDTLPATLNISSTAFIGYLLDSEDPLCVQRAIPLDAGDPITGWGLSMKMYMNNIVNATLPPGHVAADPHIAFEDANGNAIANLEWHVTDSADPTLTKNEVLLNGLPVIPTTLGVKPTDYPTDLQTMAGYDEAIAGWDRYTGNSFDLVMAAGKDGHTLAGINSAGPCGTVIAPSLGAGDSVLPARLVFYAGNGRTAEGGGNFQIYYQPTGTMNLYYTHALPVDDSYQANSTVPLSVSAPGVMGNDKNPDAASLTAELVSQPEHGRVVLNPDGSFTYTPEAGATGEYSFTYHLRDQVAITSTATVHLTVVAPDSTVVSLAPASIRSGETGKVTVQIDALGNESAVGFTLNFDPKTLQYVSAKVIDSATGATVNLNENQVAEGILGVGIFLPLSAPPNPPKTFPVGRSNILEVTFQAVDNLMSTTDTPVTFGDNPVQREVVNSNAYQLPSVFVDGSVSITPCMLDVSLSASPLAPQLVNTPITLQAQTSGKRLLEYMFEAGLPDDNGDIEWSLLRDYSIDPMFTWKPTRPGDYTLRVTARRANHSSDQTVESTLSYTILPVLSGVSVTTDLPSPQTTNTPITVIAAGEGGLHVEYSFRVGYQDSKGWHWTVLRNFAQTPTCLWNPTSAHDYTIMVYARETGHTTPYDVMQTTPFTVAPPVSAVSLKASPANTASANTTITLTAKATGGAQVEYDFQAGYQDALGWHWQDIQSYSESNVCYWVPQSARKYTVMVMAREEDHTVAYEAKASITYNIITPITGLTLTVSPKASQLIYTQAKFTAKAIGGSNVQYSFKASYQDTSGTHWLTLKAYNSSAICYWTPGLAKTYTVYAYAREVGHTNAYDQAATVTYTALRK